MDSHANKDPKFYDNILQNILQNEDKKKINLVYNEYWNKYLIIDAIGIFEMGGNYGHLGTNNSKFTVHELISVKLIEKKH